MKTFTDIINEKTDLSEARLSLHELDKDQQKHMKKVEKQIAFFIIGKIYPEYVIGRDGITLIVDYPRVNTILDISDKRMKILLDLGVKNFKFTDQTMFLKF